MTVKFPRWAEVMPFVVAKPQASKKSRAEARLEAARTKARNLLILNEMMSASKFFFLPDDKRMLEQGHISAGKSQHALAMR